MSLELTPVVKERKKKKKKPFDNGYNQRIMMSYFSDASVAVKYEALA